MSPLTRACKAFGTRPWQNLEFEQHICFRFLLCLLLLLDLHHHLHLEDEAEVEVEAALLLLLHHQQLLQHIRRLLLLEAEVGLEPEAEDDEECFGGALRSLNFLSQGLGSNAAVLEV